MNNSNKVIKQISFQCFVSKFPSQEYKSFIRSCFPLTVFVKLNQLALFIFCHLYLMVVVLVLLFQWVTPMMQCGSSHSRLTHIQRPGRSSLEHVLHTSRLVSDLGVQLYSSCHIAFLFCFHPGKKETNVWMFNKLIFMSVRLLLLGFLTTIRHELFLQII